MYNDDIPVVEIEALKDNIYTSIFNYKEPLK
jgi:hypothetical protein